MAVLKSAVGKLKEQRKAQEGREGPSLWWCGDGVAMPARKACNEQAGGVGWGCPSHPPPDQKGNT